MKSVEIFTVKKQNLSTYNYDYVSYHVMPDAVPFAGDQFLNAEEMRVKDVQLPIIKFYNKEPNGEVIERLCAFDNDLMRLIGCMQDQKDTEICNAVTKTRQEIEKKLKPRLDKLEKYENMTFIKRIIWTITGKV